MAENKELKELPEPPKKHTLLKEFRTDKKVYKRGDKFSHKDEEVIKYLKTNKFI